MVGGEASDEELYGRVAPELIRFATTLVGPGGAADVVADAVVGVMAAPVWREARDKRALLYRSVLLTSRSWHRSESRRRARQVHAVPPEAMPDADPHPEVHDALAALSHQQRAVVFLTYWSDLDVAGVAETLGVSDGTVRKQLARARRRLREVLS